MYTCEICNESFETAQALGGHKVSAHKEKTSCSFCNKELYKANVKQHESKCKLNPKNKKVCKRENCSNLVKPSKTFCSQSCAAIYNNKKSPKRKPEGGSCKRCGNPIKTSQKYFCSRKCRRKYKKEKRFKLIEQAGEADFENVSEETNAKWIKRYLIEENRERCSQCGWNEVNPYTENVPIELDHIDGNHKNNSLENCRLLCPNCHSLTKTYKGANLGNGRTRRVK